MPPRIYQTLAPELFEYADRVAEDLGVRGYKVRIEKMELGFPYRPTLLAKRDRTTLVVEVSSSISYPRLDAWARYGKSSGQDLRVTVYLPDHIQASAQDHAQFRSSGCGLATVSSSGITQVVPPQDLALNISLPERQSLPPKLRTLLGTAYDHFGQASWREGFDEACKVLEIEARRYLRYWTRKGRIQLVTQKGPRLLTKSQIEKLTMGQLAEAFRQIVAQNYADSQIGKTLAAINDDRVLRTHHKHKKRTESRLRLNVGRHMWAIIEALKLLV